MPDRAYVNFWTREPSQALLLDRFERFLESVPLSAERPGFTSLLVRAVNPAETPLVERDLRGGVAGPADVVALAREHNNADVQCEVFAYWDLWRYEVDTGKWQRGPEPLLLIARGDGYDDGIAVQEGDLVADLGFEHLFTGDSVESPAALAHRERPPEHQEKLRRNIEQLFEWLRAVEKALPIERYLLWSEGEENLEARLDEILAVR